MIEGDPGPMQDVSNEWRSLKPLAAAYAVYVPLATVLVVLSRHQLNLDGVSYLRVAKYYAELDCDLAVSGYWAPLLPWLLIPWHLIGADPLLGAKVLNAAAGALFILAVHRLLRVFKLRGVIAGAVLVGSGLLALRWLPRGITPDMLLAALLTLYLARSCSMSRSLSARDAAWAGALAGVGYLAKYYTLPFFVLHHSLAAFLVSTRVSGRWPDRRHLRCWVTGVAACLAVAGPWIGVLSLKHGRPTFATTGSYARSYSYFYDGGLRTYAEGYWPPVQLMRLREGRIASWENPDEITVPWPQLRPFAGASGMVTQLRLLFINARDVAQRIFAADGLGLMYLALIMLPLMACLPRANALGVDPWRWRWSLAAVGAYLSGLILVFGGSPRYYWPLQGLLLALVGALAVAAAAAVAAGRDRASRYGSPRLWQMAFALLIVGACALPGLDGVRAALSRPGLDLARAANTLKALNVKGPMASNHWHHTVALAYHLDTPCAGVPEPGCGEEVLRRLRRVGAGTLLLFEGESQPAGAADLGRLATSLGPPSHVVVEGNLRIRVFDVDALPGAVGPLDQANVDREWRREGSQTGRRDRDENE